MSTSVATKRRAAAGAVSPAVPLGVVRSVGAAGSREDVYAELCAALFSGFPRRDQRLKAEQYLHGLLTAQGRKSIRNIAAQIGGPAAEQSLHHFVSSSTWDWQPMRAALAHFLERNSCPQAWVVRRCRSRRPASTRWAWTGASTRSAVRSSTASRRSASGSRATN